MTVSVPVVNTTVVLVDILLVVGVALVVALPVEFEGGSAISFEVMKICTSCRRILSATSNSAATSCSQIDVLIKGAAWGEDCWRTSVSANIFAAELN